MELGQISAYQLVQEADAIGLGEKEASIYFRASGLDISRANYYIYKKKVKARKREALFTIAKNLPEAHITQIQSLKLLRKKLFMKFLSTVSATELTNLANTIVTIERTISEYNGWTQLITEDTIKKFGAVGVETPETKSADIQT